MSAAPVVVIGGGLTGALVASSLLRAGHQVEVLEAGPRPLGLDLLAGQADVRATASRLANDPDAWRYEADVADLEWLRVRALGGRTWLWGGWLERPSAAALAWAATRGAPWPMSRATLDRALRRADRRLSASSLRAAPPFARGLGRVRPKRAALGPGGTRPWTVWDLLPLDRVRPEHPVVGLEVQRGRVRGVHVLAYATRSARTIPARAVVLCASPVESARLVATLGPPFNAHVAHGFVDHLVAGRLVLHHRPAAPRSGPLDRSFTVRSREPLATIELSGPFAATDLPPEDRSALGIPAGDESAWSFTALFAFIELDPDAGRQVRFDGALDALGRKAPRFVLGTTRPDELSRCVAIEAQLDRLARGVAHADDEIVQTRETGCLDVIGHEAGLCRMGADARSGVADPWGRVFGVEGLYVGDASRMPSALDTHPSLTVSALALLTADAVRADLGAAA